MGIPRSGAAVRTGFIATLLFVVLSGSSLCNASAIFSLSGDWSNTTNPNGPWSYNQASNPLPLVSS